MAWAFRKRDRRQALKHEDLLGEGGAPIGGTHTPPGRHGAPATRFVHANGLELAYDSFGDAGAPALLLIMGLGTQMIAWDEGFCAMLAAQGYRVIRFDNRDVGLSTRIERGGVPDINGLLARTFGGFPIESGSVPYTLADMADDAAGLLDALGIDSAHVVGASMGGAIGQEMALRHPRRVRTLVSIMATSGAPGLPPPTKEALLVLLTPSPTGREGYIERYLWVMRILRGRVTSPEDEANDAARAARAFERGINPPGYARQLAAILASGSRRQRLANLHAPTLVIHGDSDPLVPIECGMDVASAVPGASMLNIEGMGHELPAWAWPRIVAAVAEHAVWTD
ncbi:MAG: alpha/beta fold hydrolase [Proteobacteria bacterium]|nr:alpha/beta fold hydrolase [Pseudomonadota bacterium]